VDNAYSGMEACHESHRPGRGDLAREPGLENLQALPKGRNCCVAIEHWCNTISQKSNGAPAFKAQAQLPLAFIFDGGCCSY